MARWSNYPPAKDNLGASYDYSFGSSHSAVFVASFCEGSVRGISFSIDPDTHRRLGNRKDGQVIDTSDF